LGWTLTSNAEVCKSCAIEKAKQKSVPEESKSQPLKENERRVYLDISVLKPRPAKKGEKSYHVGKPNWRLIVDEETQMK